jgi:hypothetical protein
VRRTERRRRLPVGRTIALLAYAAIALGLAFPAGGGFAVLLFFGVWAGVWVAFSLFWRWADETRRTLLRRRGYY